MQNLPITAIPSASPAKPPVSTDSSPAQASEPFSNVLSRQQASASTANTGAKDSKPSDPSPASDAPSASGNEQSSGLQAPASVSMLPDGILAALLPVSSDIDSDESRGMTDPQSLSQGAITALPGDMLATLLSPSATSNSITANEKNRLRETAPARSHAGNIDIRTCGAPGKKCSLASRTPCCWYVWPTRSIRKYPGCAIAVWRSG